MATFSINENSFINLPDDLSGEKGNYSPVEYIGRGGNGIVVKADDKLTGESVAIKISIQNGRDRNRRFRREIGLLKKIKSSGIIGYMDNGQCLIKIRGHKYNENKEFESAFLVMELGSQNLFEYIKSHYPIAYHIYAGQFLNLADGLAELHKKHIVHRDIKPENILIVGNRWVIADLGLCSDPNSDIDITAPHEMLGPKYWMSPEGSNRLINKKIKLSYSSDVFQLAAIIWFVINKTLPVGIIVESDWLSSDKSFMQLLFHSLLHNHNLRPQTGKIFYEEVSEIIKAVTKDKAKANTI